MGEKERERILSTRPLPVKIITGPWQSGQCEKNINGKVII